MTLTDAQIEQYSRQILLPEVGGRGQERLLAARALVAGADAAATTTAELLARAGVTVNDAAAAPDIVVDLGAGPPARADRPVVLGALAGAQVTVATLVGRPCGGCFDARPRTGTADAGALAAPARLALAALAASEALRVLLAPPPAGRLTTLDLATGSASARPVEPTTGCALCGGSA